MPKRPRVSAVSSTAIDNTDLRPFEEDKVSSNSNSSSTTTTTSVLLLVVVVVL